MKRDPFLNCIISGDEIWVHLWEPESKQSLGWKHPSISTCNKSLLKLLLVTLFLSGSLKGQS